MNKAVEWRFHSFYWPFTTFLFQLFQIQHSSCGLRDESYLFQECWMYVQRRHSSGFPARISHLSLAYGSHVDQWFSVFRFLSCDFKWLVLSMNGLTVNMRISFQVLANILPASLRSLLSNKIKMCSPFISDDGSVCVHYQIQSRALKWILMNQPK